MSAKAHPPELKKYMDKRLSREYCIHSDCHSVTWSPPLTVRLNGQRVVTGILRGFDPFMNLVLDEAHEVAKKGEKIPIGMVVIRGNSVVLLEALDRI